jgi:hypothetical protein
MKFSKRIAALALSAVMVVSQSIPALAEDPTNATTATAGDGNIVAYANYEVLAPTALKVTFNPQGYDIYESSSDTAKLSDDQIVSLNYGFASNATVDILANVTFEAEGAEDIIFVDSEDEITSAKKGEYKVYLAVATNSAAITNAADSSSTEFKVNNGASTATAALLSDVAMTADTANNVAFAAGDGNKASAEISLSMNKAEYQVKDGSKPTFDTDQTALKTMMELKTLGGINGFTFTGAMNEDADWTKASVNKITITPTFDLTKECTGEEEILDGTAAQVATEPAAPASYLSSNTVTVANKSVTITASDVTVKSVVLTLSGADTTLTSGNHYTVSGTTLSFPKLASSWVGGKITVTFSDDHTEEITVE